jgi:hypothetical protein
MLVQMSPLIGHVPLLRKDVPTMITIRPTYSAQIEQVRTALASSAIFDLRRLFVVATDDGLTLRGSVSSYYHKQLAQETALAVADVPVVNAIAVAQ